jgi:murein DD-endopeptidase MepM/ murein hydrolase activator NlpD
VSGLIPIGSRAGATAAVAGDAAERQQIALAAREFEAMFLQQMLQQMRRSMLSEDVKEEGLGAGTMTDTMDAELSRQLAGQSGGLYDVLVQAFSAHGAPGPAGVPASGPGSAPAILLGPGAAEPQLALPEGRISSRFGWRTDPLTGGSRFHNGVDIAAAYGTDVPSAGAGRVVFAGVQGGYGQTVVLEHDGGVQTRYAHLSHVAVTAGAQVDRGTPVGRVGTSGRSTGAHLHFEVLEAGRPVDPVRAAEVTDGLKITAGAADYPRGTVRTVVSPEE